MKGKWKWVAIGAGVLVVLLFGFRWWRARRFALPKGVASGNGRIESKEVDVSTKLPLRIKEVLAAEGDLVKPGQVLVRMDTVTLEAELAESNAAVAAAQEQLAVAEAAMVKKRSEIELAKIERNRSRHLVAERAGSQREYDVRKMTVKTTTAGLAEETAKLKVAIENVDVARANVAKVQSRINDATLTSPVIGRVLYRLAEPGEVLPAGGKALTLINLEDVYMEIYLPSKQAAALKLGSDARLTVDYEPGRAAVGYVSFVSPEAQFTPKEVETKSEREKLMFRVKIQVPKELVSHYVERIKTGVRGVGYVRTDDSVAWPGWLDKDLVRP
jgi:HlyD family secretion protein